MAAEQLSSLEDEYAWVQRQEKVFGIRDSNFHIPIQDVIGIEAFSSE